MIIYPAIGVFGYVTEFLETTALREEAEQKVRRREPNLMTHL